MRFAEAHSDMRRYLQEDCYCPGEIYDTTGFSFMVFDPDDECELREQTDEMTVLTAACKSRPNSPQAILFWHDEPDEPGRIIDAQRVDATENNIAILCDIARGAKPDGRKLDRFEDNHDAEDVKKLLSMCDGIIVS